MKIIKEGTPPAKRQWRGNCHSCGTIAEAEESELKGIEWGNQLDPEPFCWMLCPICNSGPFNGLLFYPKSKGGA